MARDNYDNEAFTADYFAQYENTISNGEARIPICFCIDTSSSMQTLVNKDDDFEYTGDTGYRDGNKVSYVNMKPGIKPLYRIEELKRVLNEMLARMRYNRIIRNAAVVCIVTFDRFADCIVEFSEPSRVSSSVIERIKTNEDVTNASKGIEMALERLDQFRYMNSMAGNESYKPVFVLMSDGNVKEDAGAERASRKVRERSDNGTLNVIPIAIGGADEEWLRRLSREARVYHMNTDEEFDRVFDIITKRITKTAMVITVDEELKTPAIDDEVEPVDEKSSTLYGTAATDAEMSAFLKGHMMGC